MVAESASTGDRKKCLAEVSEPPWYIHNYRCSRYAVESVHFEKGIAFLCRQHATRAKKNGGLRIISHGHLKVKEQVKAE